MNGKVVFAREVKALAEQFLNMKQSCTRFQSAYKSNGFRADGHNPITDSDLEKDKSINFTAIELEQTVEMLGEFNNFIKNSEVKKGDYLALITKILY